MSQYKTKFLILFTCLFILLFLIFEIILRIDKFSYNTPFFKEDIPFINREINQRAGIYQFDSRLFWRYRPNSEEKDWGIKINSLGFRDYEFSAKKNNKFRIIVLGDSITVGHALRLEETYCKQLEELLNKGEVTKRYEVINGGVPGYTSFQGARYFKIISKKFNPDLVIVYYGTNDGDFARCTDNDLSPFKLTRLLIARNIYLRLRSLQFFLKKIYNRGGLNNIDWKIRVSPEDFRANMETIKKDAKKDEVKILFVKPCQRFEIVENNTEQLYIPPHPYIDLYDLFKNYRDNPSEVFLDDKHFTLWGNKIIAAALCKKIYEQNFLVANNQ